MILLDVNILVYAHREETEHHDECLRFLESALDGPSSVGLSELVLNGALRILTHPKIFSHPTPLAKAIEFVSALRNQRHADFSRRSALGSFYKSLSNQ